jgi:hypothetical protein
MRTIKDRDGIEYELGEQVYQITEDEAWRSYLYGKGTRVRAISGSDKSVVLGYHPNFGYLMVCRIDAQIAEFVGIKREHLKPDPFQVGQRVKVKLNFVCAVKRMIGWTGNEPGHASEEDGAVGTVIEDTWHTLDMPGHPYIVCFDPPLTINEFFSVRAMYYAENELEAITE